MILQVRRARALVIVLCLLSMPSCVGLYKPPHLSPQANIAWEGIRVIRALDVIRDVAVDGNALTPPAISTPITRQIVDWHSSAITIVHSATDGWAHVVDVSLMELTKRLPPDIRLQLDPYITTARIVLQEVHP